MNKYFKALVVGVVALFAKLIPFNHIIGSSYSYFSLSTIVVPVIGQQYGLGWVLAFLLSKKLCIAPSYSMIFHRMPLLCAAHVFQKKSFVFSIFLPILCMLLFIIHPIGQHAWPYALYWLIPMGLSLVEDSLCVRSLQASFIAHAVGSVVWLYSGNIPAQVWMTLIPIVAYERLLLACGMVIFSQALKVAMVFCRSLRRSFCKQVCI